MVKSAGLIQRGKVFIKYLARIILITVLHYRGPTFMFGAEAWSFSTQIITIGDVKCASIGPNIMESATSPLQIGRKSFLHKSTVPNFSLFAGHARCTWIQENIGSLLKIYEQNTESGTISLKNN
jgi:hypothetical protein